MRDVPPLQTARAPFPPPSCLQDVDYEAELILSTLMESHAGAAAATAAAAAAGRAVNGGGAELRTPAGGAAAGLGIDSPGGDGVPSTGRGQGATRGAHLGLSPAPGLPPGRTFPGAAVARPGSAGAAGPAGGGQVGQPRQAPCACACCARLNSATAACCCRWSATCATRSQCPLA